MKFQEIILALQKFWSEQGCILAEPYDVEKGAGTPGIAPQNSATTNAPTTSPTMAPIQAFIDFIALTTFHHHVIMSSCHDWSGPSLQVPPWTTIHLSAAMPTIASNVSSQHSH